jgi:hypothetical protein
MTQDLEATMRKIYLLGLFYVGLSVVYVVKAREARMAPDDLALTLTVQAQPDIDPIVEPATEPANAVTWFHSMKAYCNLVEVETRVAWTPAPQSNDGTAYTAACFALAGHVDTARELILALGDDHRWRAAGVVFNVGHPVADAGNNEAAGPLMELVVEFWPNHYMALYHAGAARHALGDHGAAHGYLVRFLEHYDPDDGWRQSALGMIADIESR